MNFRKWCINSLVSLALVMPFSCGKDVSIEERALELFNEGDYRTTFYLNVNYGFFSDEIPNRFILDIPLGKKGGLVSFYYIGDTLDSIFYYNLFGNSEKLFDRNKNNLINPFFREIDSLYVQRKSKVN